MHEAVKIYGPRKGIQVPDRWPFAEVELRRAVSSTPDEVLNLIAGTNIGWTFQPIAPPKQYLTTWKKQAARRAHVRPSRVNGSSLPCCSVSFITWNLHPKLQEASQKASRKHPRQNCWMLRSPPPMPIYLGKSKWCPRWESNPHALRRGILNPLRLPFRHLGHGQWISVTQREGPEAKNNPGQECFHNPA